MTATSTIQASSGPAIFAADALAGENVVLELMDDLKRIRDSDPSWWAMFEDMDADTCSRSDLLELINTAPSSDAKFFLLGKWTMRTTIAGITGREFN